MSQLGPGSSLVTSVERSEQEGERWSSVALQKWVGNLVWMSAAVNPEKAEAGRWCLLGGFGLHGETLFHYKKAKGKKKGRKDSWIEFCLPIYLQRVYLAPVSSRSLLGTK